MVNKLLCFLILNIQMVFAISTISAKEVPLAYFYRLPMIQSPALSPDGQYVASIYNHEGASRVAVASFEEPEKLSMLMELAADEFRFESITWANNQKILVSLSRPINISGVRLRTNHIFSIDRDGKSNIELRTNRAKNTKNAAEFYLTSPHLLNLLKNDPEHILVTMRDGRDEHYSSIFKVNVSTGEFEKHIPNKYGIVDWVTTEYGEVLVGIGVSKKYNNNTRTVYVRNDSESEWQLVKTFEEFKTETFSPVVYEKEKGSLIVLSDYKLKKNSLWRYDIKAQKFSELIAEAPGSFDISKALIRNSNGKKVIIGYAYNDKYQKKVYFDSEDGNISKEFEAFFGGKGLQANLYDWDELQERYIVSTKSDTSPEAFFLYDKKSNKLKRWFSQYPELSRVKLSKVTPISFPANDGMQLNGFLTIPEGVKNPPIILFPHGGPYAQDNQYFDSYVQFFASRGFAVLQVNFRGSTGFGSDYEAAGYNEWGNKMQTDLIDALDWVEKNKLTETPKRCIVGMSYGGYAALVAGFKTPERFDCIVSIAGVSNLEKQIIHWDRIGADNYYKNVVKNSVNDIGDISPINFAEKFQSPVLLIHGELDSRVKYEQSENMYDALKKSKKEVDFKLLKSGTHHIDDADNSRIVMESLDLFLKKYLSN